MNKTSTFHVAFYLWYYGDYGNLNNGIELEWHFIIGIVCCKRYRASEVMKLCLPDIKEDNSLYYLCLNFSVY